MLNTYTLVQQYIEFCKRGTATPDGFLKLVTSEYMLPVFVAFVIAQGYNLEQWEEWESEIYVEDGHERFFEDIENAFEMLVG